MYKDMLKTGGMLCIITFVIVLLLAVGNYITEDKIAENKQKAEEQARTEIIAADSFTQVEDNIFAAQKDGETVGYTVNTVAVGYGGDINLTVGVSKSGEIMGIKIISHSETAGLGAKAAEQPFTSLFKGKTAPLEVTKNAPKGNEIAAISGATRTSKGVTNAVNSAVETLYGKGLISR